MEDDDTPGAGPVWNPAPRLSGLITRTTTHCYIQNMKALGLVVSEKKIFFYVFLITPRGVACMSPRGTVGRIYKDEHCTNLYSVNKIGQLSA